MAPSPNRKQSPTKKTVGEFTEEQARKLLEKKEMERREQFLKEYEALCTKYSLQVQAMPLPPVQLVVAPFNPQGNG